MGVFLDFLQKCLTLGQKEEIMKTKFFNLHKKNQGYTLVEILLVVGLIMIMSVGIYSTYRTKMEQQKADSQSQLLASLNKDIKGVFANTNSFSALTPANLISAGIVPQEMRQGTNLVSLYRSPINVGNALVGGQQGYFISLNNIPSNACTLLALNDNNKDVQQIIVNATTIKNVNTPFNTINVANAAAACSVGGVNNTITFRDIQKLGLPVAAGPVVNKGRINPYYVPTVGNNVTSPATACAGGSAWNGSFCACPAGYGLRYTGTGASAIYSCVQYGTNGMCPPGQSWVYSGPMPALGSNGAIPPKQCMATTTTRPNPHIVGTVVSNFPAFPSRTTSPVSSPAPTYTGNRTVPVSYAAPYNPGTFATIPATVGQAQITSPGYGSGTPGNGVCIAGGNWDGRTCQSCVNGSWNGFRCVPD